MPIDIDRFEADSEEDLDDGRSLGPAHVLSFLRSNPDRAFTAAEIQAEIGSGPTVRSAETMGISGVLSGLEARGLVRQRAGYWALTAAAAERTRRRRVVYEGPDGVRERTHPDVQRESGWVLLAADEDDGEGDRYVPRERIYSIEYVDVE